MLLETRVLTVEREDTTIERGKVKKNLLLDLNYNSSFITKRPKSESIQMFISRRMGNKTEQTTNIYSSIDESQKHIEKRKPDTKEYILYTSHAWAPPGQLASRTGEEREWQEGPGMLSPR